MDQSLLYVSATLIKEITIVTMCDNTLVFPANSPIKIDLNLGVAWCLGTHFYIDNDEYEVTGVEQLDNVRLLNVK